MKTAKMKMAVSTHMMVGAYEAFGIRRHVGCGQRTRRRARDTVLMIQEFMKRFDYPTS